MNRLWVGLAVAFQLIVVVWMAVEREWVLTTGQSVWLRTAPLDPRDIFRGDYVELDYEISLIGREQQVPIEALGKQPDPGDRVYVALEIGAGGLAEASMMDVQPPEDGIFLRGRVKKDWRSGTWRALRVKYGIEKYFVDRKHGEWFWRIDRNGRPDPAEPKVSQWKGPYHNVRACLETIRRFQQIISADTN